MCRRVTCNVCGRPSFAGCGRHVESVLKDVPLSERCRCRAAEVETVAEAPKPSLLRRLFGRSAGGGGDG
jgi:hypothetical protein